MLCTSSENVPLRHKTVHLLANRNEAVRAESGRELAYFIFLSTK